MSTTDTEVEIETELHRVIEWRRRELERAGYDAGAAHSLATRVEIDLHRATDLLRGGCPAATALRILL